MANPLLLTAAAFVVVLALALLTAEWLARRNSRLHGAILDATGEDQTEPPAEPGSLPGAL